MLTRSRLLWILLFCGYAGAVLVLGSHLWFLLTKIHTGAIHEDYSLYATVARGMLNGLRPYADLFESKPPGMFLLALLSLFVSGGHGFALLLEEFLGCVFIVCIIGIAWKQSSGIRTWQERTISTCLTLLLAMALLLYMEEMSGGLQTETFGGLFGALYACSLSRKNTKMMTIMRALLLLSSIGMKEPFVLTTFAAALLLSKKPADVFSTFVLPFCIAAGSGAIVLLLMGAFGNYLHIYLPLVLMNRVTFGSEPLFIRGFEIWKMFGNLLFSSVPVLAVVLFCLWIAAPIARKKLGDRSMLLSLGLCFLSLYLTGLAVGSGNYNYYHFIFALPVYVALILLFLRSIPYTGKQSFLPMGIGILILLCAYTVHFKPQYLALLEHRQEIGPVANAALTKQFDALMQACSLHRYFADDEYQRLQESHFSPIGPMFAPHGFTAFVPANHPLFTETWSAIQNHADLLLFMHGQHIPPSMADNNLFTTNVPACAAPYSEALGKVWDVYFRK